MCEVNVIGGTLPQEEIDAYIARGTEQYGRTPDSINITVDGEFVDLEYHFNPQNFERVRRISGYLVGTRDKFNNAKRAEEADRVKHSLS